HLVEHKYYLSLCTDAATNEHHTLPLHDALPILLEELVSPVPKLFRDVAKHSIASKIGELALEQNKTKITKELLIEGYIIGTPKRDHKFLRKKLAEENIDVTPYERFFAMSKDDYAEVWKQRHQH